VRQVLLFEAGDDQGDSPYESIPLFNFASTEYEPMRWDYFVNHYDDPARQEKDNKLVWTNSTGGTYVGVNPPAGSTKKGIWYPRAGTLVSTESLRMMTPLTRTSRVVVARTMSSSQSTLIAATGPILLP
jgi:hypothetical protein